MKHLFIGISEDFTVFSKADTNWFYEEDHAILYYRKKFFSNASSIASSSASPAVNFGLFK